MCHGSLGLGCCTDRSLTRQNAIFGREALQCVARSQRSLRENASRIYGLGWKIGVFDGMAKYLTYEMARLGYGLACLEAEQYLQTVKGEAKEMTMSAQVK